MKLACVRGSLFLDDARTSPGGFADVVRVLLLLRAGETIFIRGNELSSIKLYTPKLSERLGYVQAAYGSVPVGQEAFRGEVDRGHFP